MACRISSRAASIFATCVVAAVTTRANNAPVVSNVTASQRPDASRLVDFYYNLADADGDTCTVWAMVSADGGLTFTVPAQTFFGHVGSVAPGNGRHMIWDAGADIPGAVLSNVKVRVVADDGNGLAPMVLVPGSYFSMGDPWSEGGTDERPVHQVWVSTFRIDKYEVTNAFYCQFLNYGGNDDHWVANQKITRVGVPGAYFYAPLPGYANHPVVYVSHTDATHFCDWRSAVEGLPVGTYRLPTEAQWEKAAGWNPNQHRHYRFGEGTDGGGVNTLDGHRANYSSSGDPFDNGTTPVGYYNGSTYGTYTTQNAVSFFGCYDMSGNVREWCYDWYSSTYYQTSPSSDPQGPTSGSSRVLRGGSWNGTPSNLRSALRDLSTPANRYSYVGFRCSSGAP